MGIYHPPADAHDTVIKAALRVIQATHYARADDPHADAEHEYAREQLALAARALTEAVDRTEPDEQPIGWAGVPPTEAAAAVPFAAPGGQDFAEAVDQERQAQLAKWGGRQHPDGTGNVSQLQDAVRAREWCRAAFGSGHGTWSDVLSEGVAGINAERDPAKLRAALVRVGAVCAVWADGIDHRPGPKT